MSVRRRGPARLGLLVGGLLLLAASAGRAADFDEDLDRRDQKELIELTQAYLDPSREFVWPARKDLLARLAELEEEEGVRALADLAFLRGLVYSGRHFKPEYDHRDFEDAYNATTRRSGIYRNVTSERLRFTYTVPRDYPSGRSRDRKIPRDKPFPLLVSLHTEHDWRTHADAPGEAALERRWGGGHPVRSSPIQEARARSLFEAAEHAERQGDAEQARSLYEDVIAVGRTSYRAPARARLDGMTGSPPLDETAAELHERWIALAPVAPRGAFTEEDRTIRHRLATAVLAETWTRYHVDFDRIVLEGRTDAAIIASAHPYIYAGLVLRGGEIEPDLVVNYASVPVYVVADEALAQALEDAGHPDVTRGRGGAPLLAWMEARRRRVPRDFMWRVKRADHQLAHWINIEALDWHAPDRVMRVQVLDTAQAPNTIRIDAAGLSEVSLFLNDEIVDLDRPVRFVLDGQVREPGHLVREIGQLFERDPNVRKAMYFGWLYPTFVEGLRLRGDGLDLDDHPAPPPAPAGGGDEPAPPAPAPRTPASRMGIDEPTREAVEEAFLLGRLEALDDLLGQVADPVARWPLALRHLWWRRPPGGRAMVAVRVGALREALEAAREARSAEGGPAGQEDLLGLLDRRLDWLLAEGEPPYPRPAVGGTEPWPVIADLVEERLRREQQGPAGLPQESPLHRAEPPYAAWAPWWDDWRAYVLDDVMAVGLHGLGPDQRTAEEQAAWAAEQRLARRVRRRNLALAVGLLVGFVLLVVGAGRAIRPAPPAS